MPRVTLYVREADEELWERAKALAGDAESLSAMVTEALREYVTRKERAMAAREATTAAMQEIELEVNVESGGMLTARTHKVRFTGALLAESGVDYGGFDYHAIYVTRGGRFVLYTRGEDGRLYRVYDTLDRLARANRHLPKELLARAAEALGEEYVVEID